MNKLAIIILTGFVIAGCKPATTRKTDKTVNGNDSFTAGLGGLVPADVRNFTAAEMTIGSRICSAFKYKRDKIAKLTDGAEKFSFTGQWKACGETNPVALAQYGVTILNFKYIPDLTTTKSFQEILTDESEPIRTLCTNLAVSVSVSNFIKFDGSNYFVKLYNVGGYDTFELAKMSKNAKGAYALVGTQSVAVITAATTPKEETRLMGIEKFRTLNLTCTGSTDFTSLSHTWVGATTPYKFPGE